MENNKLLIGLVFVDANETKQPGEKEKHRGTTLEVYVVRDMLLKHLLDGIYYGLKKLAGTAADNQGIYSRCLDIYEKSRCEKDEQGCFNKITLTSYNAAAVGEGHNIEGRFVFSESDLEKPLCDLGFITSCRIIFDSTGSHTPGGMLHTGNVITAFNPGEEAEIVFPEYNISTRQMYQFDTTPVELIAPTDPPQKPNNSLFSLLIPSVISLGSTVVIRLLMSGTGTGLSMALLSLGMGIAAAITTVIQWRKQKKSYEKSLQEWRSRYESYISAVFADIKNRQRKDTERLDQLYPDMMTLLNRDDKGVYTLNEHIYSRAPQDPDFLTFRIGLSDEVPSFFEIKGEKKETVFSQAFFEITDESNGYNGVRLYLREELEKELGEKENLCNLPYVASRRYAHLTRAPLLYSLKNKGCLGIVDRAVHTKESKAYIFVSRMIFELCYYHKPEDLQFVVFFDQTEDWAIIQEAVERYKFLPHFRDLFPDKSQFVFGKESAHLVMSGLLGIMNERQNEEHGTKTPHIVVIVFDEHGLKEHAFAEYLPKAPEEVEERRNELGLSFVFAAKFKEYLPSYCDDIVDFTDKMTLTPRDNIAESKVFGDEYWKQAAFNKAYTTKLVLALRFLSSVYYAKIAQNGKVPSSVSLFEIAGIKEMLLQSKVCENWGFSGERAVAPVTKSLQVPIGKTESGLAYLDLHEKKDGPHMLVAGTTGSGKTEAILSFLLGLCMQYRPDEVNLLLVDMKGGGFTKRIGHLPHVVGSVTDVDGDENGTGAEYMLSRFLSAMKSEIKRRKLLLNKLHVDSLDGYIEACGNIEAHIAKKKLSDEDAKLVRDTAKESPLTHLVLVVDEFTELKRFSNENSDIDFMGEITTIARVGRSLGLHIILISQNIEGAITDDIRVNTNARYCLKVATKQASKEMIGTELAASAYMPGIGRAYLLVGAGAKLTYFQSAYSGGGVEESAKIEITLASKTGENTCFYRSDEDNEEIRRRKETRKLEGTEKSQLEAICEAIVTVSKQEKINAPKKVFSNPLPSHIAWDREKDEVIDLNKRRGAAQ